MLNRRTFAVILTALLAAAPVAAAQTHDHGALSIKITGKDYAFELPKSVPAGYVNIELTNTGKEFHHAQVVRLKDGVTPQAFGELAAKDEGAAMAQIEMVGGVGQIAPGAKASATVDLRRAGTYMVLCFVPNDKGVPHLALGMTSVFVIEKDNMTAQAPVVNATAVLKDFEIILPATVSAGRQTWKFVNEGPQPHEMMLGKLNPGKTVADVEAFLKTGQGEMPVTLMGGAQALSKGFDGYADFDFQPGEYVALCFVPSGEHKGAPHFALGMVKFFKVEAKVASK